MSPYDPQNRNQLRSTTRERGLFVCMVVLHFFAVLLPYALISFGFWELKKEEAELSINLVDEPSVGPKVAPVTTRLEYAPEPPKDAAPEPIPEPDIPDLPDLPDVPTPPPPSEPSFEVPPLPAPPAPSRPKPVKEPTFNAPKMPKKKPSKPAKPRKTPSDRRMTTTKTGRKTGRNNNDLVPIGKDDLAQMFGKKSSNTPQGGPKPQADYSGKLVGFLKMHWQSYAPSRAELGSSRKFETRVEIALDGSGRVIEAKITRSSGNARMDEAVRRMLSSLRQYPAPEDKRPVRMRDIVIETEE